MGNKNDDARILLVVDGYGSNAVGQQFLDTMLSQHNKTSIWRFSLVRNNSQGVEDNVELFQNTSSAIPVLSTFYYQRYRKTDLQKGLRIITQIVEDEKIQIVWFVLNSHQNIELAAAFSEVSSAPYIVNIWDAPEYLAQQSRFDPISKQHSLNAFARALKGAERGVVISDSMKKMYKENYGLESETMVFSPNLELFPPKKTIWDKRDVNVIFAGSLYAYKTWGYFLDAIEKRNKSNDVKINVTCMGKRSRWDKKRSWVKYLGYLPVEQAAILVNQSDVAYLPYWFAKKHSHAVKTAFPSKLSFYTTCGTPIFYHGPEKSTPTDFLAEYKVGVSCHAKESYEIIKSFDKLLSDGFLNDYNKERERAISSVFSTQKCTDTFYKVIDSVLI